MAMVSPSHPSPAVIQRMSSSSIFVDGPLLAVIQTRSAAGRSRHTRDGCPTVLCRRQCCPAPPPYSNQIWRFGTMFRQRPVPSVDQGRRGLDGLIAGVLTGSLDVFHVPHRDNDTPLWNNGVVGRIDHQIGSVVRRFFEPENKQVVVGLKKSSDNGSDLMINQIGSVVRRFFEPENKQVVVALQVEI